MPTDDANNFNSAISVNSVTSEPAGVYSPVKTQEAVAAKPRTPREEVYAIIREIADAAGTGVTVDEVLGKSRFRHIVAVRHEAIVRIAARFPWMSYPHLARLMGKRDHTTIMHALKKMGALQPRMTPGRGLAARTYGHHIDSLFVRIGAALSVPETTTEGETHHENS